MVSLDFRAVYLVALVSLLAMLAAGGVAYFLARDEAASVAEEGTRLERIDRLFPYVGLALAALLFGLVAVLVLLG